MPDAQPKEWVDALTALLNVLPWVGGILGVVFVVRYALVPLIRAIRGKGE
jgi:hypothetical protein